MIGIKYFFMSNAFLLFGPGDGLTRPVDDAAELLDVVVAEVRELLRRFFTASAAAAIDLDQLIFVLQRADLTVTDGLIGDADRVRDVTRFVLLFGTNIEDDIILFCLHPQHHRANSSPYPS